MVKRAAKSVRRSPAKSRKREQAAPDALALLKADHKIVRELFDKFEKMEGRMTGKKALAAKIIKELSIHTNIEETVFYPAVRQKVREAKKLILESYEEHYVAEWLLSELERMEPGAERFDPKMMVMMESVRHHLKEEESELFPMVRKAMSAAELRELGARLMMAKKKAPTHPMPRVTDVENPMARPGRGRQAQNGTVKPRRRAYGAAVGARRTRPEMHARH
jgi:hemerythrin superfamily protein